MYYIYYRRVDLERTEGPSCKIQMTNAISLEYKIEMSLILRDIVTN